MGLVNAKEMLEDANRERYAIGHFNLNNMESIRAFLLASEEARSPIILAVSGGTANYMGGYRTIRHMVEDFIRYLKITVPVALHVDHGTYEEAMDGIRQGFTSVMFDGSSLPIERNLQLTKEVLELAEAHGISVEAEVGGIGGEEDGKISMGERANPEHCKMMADWGGFSCGRNREFHGNILKTGKGWISILVQIKNQVGRLPLVLHGGSGIPEDQILKAIELGVNKINVNTECQIAFTEATRKYFEEGKDLASRGFAPRAMLAPGLEATKQLCIRKMELFGSVGRV